jgi:hypothetical protein
VSHIGAGCFFLAPSLPCFSTRPPYAQHVHTESTTTHRSHQHHTPSVGSSSMGRRSEEEDETRNEAEAGLRALVLLWRSWRSFRLPTRQWACTPPLRLTSVPVNIPLTEASAHLQDNRPLREVKRWPVRLLTLVAGGRRFRCWGTLDNQNSSRLLAAGKHRVAGGDTVHAAAARRRRLAAPYLCDGVKAGSCDTASY